MRIPEAKKAAHYAAGGSVWQSAGAGAAGISALMKPLRYQAVEQKTL
jgi:hypothetical protein